MRFPSNLLLALTMSSSALLSAQQTAASIDVPAGSQLILQAKGEGVQIYNCTNPNGTMKWMLKAPDAKLLDASEKEIGTHFAGPTWKLTDNSQVQGELVASQPSPDGSSIPWLMLRAKPGTTTGKFSNITFIRRTETHGGVAPKTGCDTPRQANTTVSVPYSATYSFYSKQETDR